MAKKEKKAGVNPKNIQAFERLNFLHQAAVLMSTIQYESNQNDNKMNIDQSWQGDPKGTLHATSRYLNNNLKQITAKLVMRLDPSVKRTICKRCDTPLLPVITSTHRIRSKPVPTMIQTCKICKAKRKYTSQKPDYELFSERSDVNNDQ
ncbi:RNAse P Rpr2/Rpp21/SNM1 subunit domain-containing protein [Cokeromyces recurvatus]|uniref:RNAse P Rpr2/Rpp21/SNM1 subunit domain-containing protein n=1 Tax=Cokeromyces recurvatus TaxID=90255 RepID=UPI0022204578|nr:RNAse P Rpr2/Rpp21/SNM1 subunit domain-containing protein [Cokeromyces recurvatus]KAI7897774.1 RNAse P Rpr2/Rpp21/SNM1 subunit domain-containing protein [Cokeromyces recurvatus]